MYFIPIQKICNTLVLHWYLYTFIFIDSVQIGVKSIYWYSSKTKDELYFIIVESRKSSLDHIYTYELHIKFKNEDIFY
jgi:hypothetical protein